MADGIFDFDIDVSLPFDKSEDNTNNESEEEQSEESSDNNKETSEETPEDNNNEENENEGKDESEDEGEMTPLEVFYDFAKNTFGLPEIEGELSEQSLQEALEIHDQQRISNVFGQFSQGVRDLAQFGINNPSASLEDLKGFFDEFVEPAFTEYKIETDTQAEIYIRNKLKDNVAYQGLPDALDTYIDTLKDNDKIVDAANQLQNVDIAANKKKLEERQKLESQRLEADKASKKKFFEGIQKEINATNYSDKKKSEIVANLRKERLDAVNNLISKSPRAMMQIADIFSYFDINTGNFDKLFKVLEGKEKSSKTKEKESNLNLDRISTTIGKMKGSSKRKTKHIPIVLDSSS